MLEINYGKVEYKFKSKIVDFIPESEYFDQLFDITAKERLEFKTYRSPNTKYEWDLLANDCKIFAEKVSNTPCYIAYEGVGRISRIVIKQRKSIW